MRVTISNPPYNMKWAPPLLANLDDRFIGIGVPPKGNANYAFILTALKLSDRSVFLLPRGVLSHGAKEEKDIRRYIVDSNLLETIILIPNNMFTNTDITTCIMVLDKHKQNDKVAMIDLRNKGTIEVREQRGQYGGKSKTNRVYKKKTTTLSDELINEVVAIAEGKTDGEYSAIVSNEEIKKENYVLSPSRYIEPKKEERPHREYNDIIKDLNFIIEEKNCCKLTINETIAKQLGFDIELYKKSGSIELNKQLKGLCDVEVIKEDYFTTTKNKNELTFKNNSKDKISSVLMMILNTWKQHIYYLNTVENKLLEELRDTLLNDLMSGKVDINEIGENNNE